MIFKRLATNETTIEIDGIKYPVNSDTNADHYNCKETFMALIQQIDGGMDQEAPDTFISDANLHIFKKDLGNRLKDFEKKYVKHARAHNPAIAEIHNKAIQPVFNLCQSGLFLFNFNQLNPIKNFPEFRKKAIYNKFVECLTAVCDIMSNNPQNDGENLNDPYDIQHLIDLLQLPDWKDCPPFRFYLTPMQDAFDELIDECKRLFKLGALRMSYYVHRNEIMVTKIIKLVKQYNIVKELIGDDLKRDQFKTMYNVHEKVYNCALKDFYLNKLKNAAVFEKVIPELTVLQAMTTIRQIDDTKKEDEIKKKEKAAYRLRVYGEEAEEDPEELKTTPSGNPIPAANQVTKKHSNDHVQVGGIRAGAAVKSPTKKKKKAEVIDHAQIEAARQAELLRKEIE